MLLLASLAGRTAIVYPPPPLPPAAAAAAGCYICVQHCLLLASEFFSFLVVLPLYLLVHGLSFLFCFHIRKRRCETTCQWQKKVNLQYTKGAAAAGTDIILPFCCCCYVLASVCLCTACLSFLCLQILTRRCETTCDWQNIFYSWLFSCHATCYGLQFI